MHLPLQAAKDLADAYKSTFRAAREDMARDTEDGKVRRLAPSRWLAAQPARGRLELSRRLPAWAASSTPPLPLLLVPKTAHIPTPAARPQRLEVDERAVFLKFELFAKRLGKLCDMFTSIQQISGLEQHTHITGATGQRVAAALPLPLAARPLGREHAQQRSVLLCSAASRPSTARPLPLPPRSPQTPHPAPAPAPAARPGGRAESLLRDCGRHPPQAVRPA